MKKIFALLTAAFILCFSGFAKNEIGIKWAPLSLSWGNGEIENTSQENEKYSDFYFSL